MRFFNRVPLLLSLTAILPAVLAAPICHDISDYSTEWFLAHMKPQWKSGFVDFTALFYTAGLSEHARQWARKSRDKKVTIWDVWDCEYYNHHATRSNPLSCIMADAASRLTYFENMSRAFAMNAHQTAWAMHRSIENPPKNTIWGMVEEPVLKRSGGNVHEIHAVEAGSFRSKVEWRRWERWVGEGQKVLFSRGKEGEGRGEVVERRELGSCGMRADESHPLF